MAKLSPQSLPSDSSHPSTSGTNNHHIDKTSLVNKLSKNGPHRPVKDKKKNIQKHFNLVRIDSLIPSGIKRMSGWNTLQSWIPAFVLHAEFSHL